MHDDHYLIIRLMYVCVSNAKVRQQWIDAIKKCSAIKHFNFILENSLNGEYIVQFICDIFTIIIYSILEGRNRTTV